MRAYATMYLLPERHLLKAIPSYQQMKEYRWLENFIITPGRRKRHYSICSLLGTALVGLVVSRFYRIHTRFPMQEVAKMATLPSESPYTLIYSNSRLHRVYMRPCCRVQDQLGSRVNSLPSSILAAHYMRRNAEL
ncbi:hypothetical protein ARMSODRAFT_765690 [Armillaria solidipes]|uniref:Uncharacterized protein n=1 Tax=Armillaria solidipes TaxID=1076256 RepID=A0A2H3ATA1_9AGAR|nr:hypothetical protein ARMSODRAFT_765690 [Armillaria solidipes]